MPQVDPQVKATPDSINTEPFGWSQPARLLPGLLTR